MLNDNAPRSHVVNGLQTLAVAGAYFAAAKVGLQQELVGGQVTPLWPPTGIALACLLLMGLRVWPGITLGAFLINMSIGPTLLAAAAISVGNTSLRCAPTSCSFARVSAFSWTGCGTRWRWFSSAP